jgi:hypothetical protein
VTKLYGCVGVTSIGVCVSGEGGRLCGLLVRDPGYRSRDPGSIHGATSFLEK